MFLRRLFCLSITISFASTLITPPQNLYAQTVLDLPAPGTMVSVSPSFEPALIRGLTVHQDNPFLFDFIVDPGQSRLSKQALKDESERMIKYFFAALTIPDKDIWVNLSPYEKDRMIPVSLGETAMGRDLLAQDYMLKQLTASLIYPQQALGKTFWAQVYSKAKEMYGTTQIPVDTFNKVWIVPQKAGVYEHGQTAFIVDGHLKVMLEEDYLALNKQTNDAALLSKAHTLSSQIVREVILPQIEKEINEGKNFATLRQIFYAQVLAVWFKRNLKQALLNRVYANKGTVKGIDQNDAATNEAIYNQYLRAYKKGVFNYIQEDIDPITQETLPRKYFSGGYAAGAIEEDPAQLSDAAMARVEKEDVDVSIFAARPGDAAMINRRQALFGIGLIATGVVGDQLYNKFKSGTNVPTESNVQNSALTKGISVVIANRISGIYSASGNYSVWNNFSEGHDFKGVKAIKITFPTSDAGVKIAIRLLPKGSSPDFPTGLNPNVYTIPEDGIVVVPMSDFESILGANDLQNIGQISIHSGLSAWDLPLNQDANQKARFEKIETISDKAMKVTRRQVLQMGLVAAPSLLLNPRLLGQGQTQDPVMTWLHRNSFEDGMPKSFGTPKNPTEQERREFWSPIGGNSVDGVVERMLINDMLEIYDGALRQVVFAFEGDQNDLNATDPYTNTLLSGGWGELQTIRAWDAPFTYQGRTLPEGNAYFFRLISPRYLQYDPLTLAENKTGFPERERIHWVDWRPVTGENAWVIIGSLQVAYAKGRGTVNRNSKEMQLALSLVPAFKALTTPIGAVLYAPEGIYDDKTQRIITRATQGNISNENNISLHAALMMLYGVTRDPQYLKMAQGIEDYFKNYGYDRQSHTFYQGGFYTNGNFLPNKEHFAEDVQAWGILGLSPAKIDQWFGEGEAYKIWKATKERSGFYKGNQLIGVGFTDGHDVQSGEWSFGAIGAANELALYYQNSHPNWANECLADSISMLKGQEELKHIGRDGSKSYLYANKRYYIPFGWWSNRIPSLASTAWARLIHKGNDPFRLGGKTRWLTLPGFQTTVDAIAAVQEKTSPSLSSQVSNQREQNVNHVSAEPNTQHGAAIVIANGTSGAYEGPDNYSVWKVFPSRDFTGVKSIRITFPSSEAGVKIAVRLLPRGEAPDSPTGLDQKVYNIPSNGIVIIPMSEFKSVLGNGDLRNITQISIHSGASAWDLSLDQGADKRATFERIEVVSDRAMTGILRREFLSRLLVIPLAATNVMGQTNGVIADGISGVYNASGNYSVWKSFSQGRDFTGVKAIKITFPTSQAGVKIAIRLLPRGTSPDSPRILSHKTYTIPEDGIVMIPMSDFKGDLRNITQISVHSGISAWYISLNRDPDKKARFEKIEEVTSSENAPTSQPAGNSEVIAEGTSGTYSAAGNYSVWKLFSEGHDFTGVKTIRITFSTSEVGVKIAIRLLPQGVSPDSPTGLDQKVYTIPENGIVEVPMSEFESILGADDLKSIGQISIHSGVSAWDLSLDQDGNQKARFEKIEIISDRAMLNNEQITKADKAALTIRGGIDLSQQDTALHVEKDANGGVKVNVNPALIAQVEQEGMPEVIPVIINMQPADIRALFGVEA